MRKPIHFWRSTLFLILTIILLSTMISAAQTNKIAIRQNAQGKPEFYDVSTGKKFVPRGNNYIYIDEIQGYQPKYTWAYYPEGQKSDGVVVLEPGYYNPDRINADLKAMKKKGYNTVRIFVSHIAYTSNDIYLDNLADFIKRARDKNIYVILSFGFIPREYDNIMPETDPNVGGFNNYFLNPGVVDALSQYITDSLDGIKERDPSLLDNVFGVELHAEPFFLTTTKPFSMTSSYVTVYGKQYDMSNAISRQQLADDATLYWINTISGRVKIKYPTTLLSVIVIPPVKDTKSLFGGYNGVYISDDGERKFQSLRLKTVAQSNIDYIDFHIDPDLKNGPYQFKRDADALELNMKNSKPYAADVLLNKPMIIGEFGASKDLYPSINKARDILVKEQIESCKYGISGWMNWAWANQLEKSFWSMTNKDYSLANALSPNKRKDPCKK